MVIIVQAPVLLEPVHNYVEVVFSVLDRRFSGFGGFLWRATVVVQIGCAAIRGIMVISLAIGGRA